VDSVIQYPAMSHSGGNGNHTMGCFELDMLVIRSEYCVKSVIYMNSTVIATVVAVSECLTALCQGFEDKLAYSPHLLTDTM